MALQNATPLAISGFFTIALGLILLLVAFHQAKAKNFKNHKYLMVTAAIVNAAFLVQYIVRYVTGQETHFTGDDFIKYYIYYPILTIHILFAIITIFLVLIQLKNSMSHEQTTDTGVPYFDKDYRMDHRSFGRITFYLWVTSYIGGIIIFFFLYVLNF